MSSRARAKSGAPKKKKEVEEKPRQRKKVAAPPKQEVAAPPVQAAPAPKPKGKPPHALISSRHDGGMVEREGRGFSLGELKGAGLRTLDASRFRLPVDIRRRTTLDGNVQALKRWWPVPQAVPPTPQPVGEEPKVRARPKGQPRKRTSKKTE